MRTTLRSAALVLVGTLVAACTTGAAPSPTASPATSASPASPSASAPASPSAAACAPEGLQTKSPGKLTVGTDNPAYPPYFDPEPSDPAWELGNPNNGKGFESAVAYAIAEQLGYGTDDVTWVPVKFDLSFAPGPKDFDIYLAQVSDLPERRESADLSEGYYFLNQSLVAVEGTPIASAKTLADLKSYRFGAQTATTSLKYIEETIQPTTDPLVYDTNDAAIAALNNGQIDGLVVDLPTAFYVTAAQMENGVIVGQFPPAEGEQEHFSVVLEKDSPLTDCVNQAIAALKESGELDDITQEWLSDKANAPVIQP